MSTGTGFLQLTPADLDAAISHAIKQLYEIDQSMLKARAAFNGLEGAWLGNSHARFAEEMTNRYARLQGYIEGVYALFHSLKRVAGYYNQADAIQIVSLTPGAWNDKGRPMFGFDTHVVGDPTHKADVWEDALSQPPTEGVADWH